MSDTSVRNVIIIGSGPAGLTASIYAARANLKPLLIEGFNAGGLIPGGQLMYTTDVENYPGFPEKVTGQELMARFREQAKHQGTEIITADVTKAELSAKPFKIWVDDQVYLSKTVIVATGARANYIGLPNEDLLKNKGVSACAVCDGALFRGQDVVVVGGGDTAMEEATYLTAICKSVTLVHRRDEFRASKTMVERTVANPKIKILYSHVVEDVLDVKEDRVTAVVVKSLKTGEKNVVPAGAMFVAIGHTPLADLFVGQLETHPNGYVKTVPGSTRTNIPGVFASGDVQDWVFRQAVTAAGTGCMAALEAERYLAAEGAH
jgi:thioredoxin reductase (NADPH)